KAVVGESNKLPDEYWENAPNCFKWAAMDKNGDWYWFVTKPKADKEEWLALGCRLEGFQARPVKDWEKSLTKRPKITKR
ncbi:MAG TPA: hypothetical protein VKP88_06755, partial [Candidatus Paceibacterota bacterium]|nr:hypothetical protein [Candidatus Paceibacterota bacterium]